MRVGVGAGVGASFLESMGRNVIVCVQIYQKLKKTKTLRRERIHIDLHRIHRVRFGKWFRDQPISQTHFLCKSCCGATNNPAMADDAAKMDSYYQFDEAKLEEVREKKEWMKE